MIGILLLISLLLAFYEGARRGTALQFIHVIGFIVSLAIAAQSYETVGKKIELYVPYMSVTSESKLAFFSQPQSFNLDHTFYAAFAYIAIVFGGWLLTKFLAIFFVGLRFTKLFGKFDWLFGGVMNSVLVYVIVFFILFLASLFPIDAVQALFTNDSISYHIVKDSPVLSNYFYRIWVTNIIG